MFRIFPVILVLALVGCDPAAVDATRPIVTLRNANAVTAHILAAGESASAETELASGSTRQVAVPSGASGEERFFRVVVGVSEVEQIGCFLNNGISDGTEVEYTAEGALVCLRW